MMPPIAKSGDRIERHHPTPQKPEDLGVLEAGKVIKVSRGIAQVEWESGETEHIDVDLFSLLISHDNRLLLTRTVLFHRI